MSEATNIAATASKSVVVAVYDTHTKTEQAVKELEKAGFNMSHLSIVGTDYHNDQQVVAYYNAGGRMMYWGELSGFWGGLWGRLSGAAAFWVPRVGPLLVAGPLATSMVGALDRIATSNDLNVLGAGLNALGLPRDSVTAYERAIEIGKYVLVGCGTAENVATAKRIVEATEPSEVGHYPVIA